MVIYDALQSINLIIFFLINILNILMENIIKTFKIKKKKLLNYVNTLLKNIFKNRKFKFSQKLKYRMDLIHFYYRQIKLLDNERDRLILIQTNLAANNEDPAKTPSKKACLVGINYVGTSSELRGCVNDVYLIRDLLVSMYKYKVEDIVILTDEYASRENIIKEFTSLVQNAKSGDSIFFSFSGHGSNMKDTNCDEVDGIDELIVSVDHYAITDDELKNILDKYLNTDVNMFSMFDSCRSGTMLDLKYALDNNLITVINETSKETKSNVILLSGCLDNQVSIDANIKNSYNGALSYAFVNTVRNNPTLTWNELLTKLKNVLIKYEMIPQISSGNHYNIADLQIHL